MSGTDLQRGRRDPGDVLDSKTLSVAAGDEGLKTAVESGSEADQIEAIKATRTKLDDAIEPSMKETAEDAREKLDEPAAKDEEPQPEADLWARLRAGFQLDHDVDQQRVRSQLNWYKSHPRYMDRVSERGSRYLHYILNEAEKRGLPTELVLLPIVESAFDPLPTHTAELPDSGNLYRQRANILAWNKVGGMTSGGMWSPLQTPHLTTLNVWQTGSTAITCWHWRPITVAVAP